MSDEISRLIDGEPTILVETAKLLHEHLRRARLLEADVMEAARFSQGIYAVISLRRSQATSYIAIAVAVFILLVDLWAIVSVFRSDKTVGVKAGWAIGLIVFPVIGLVVWGLAGPRGIKEGPTSPEHSKG